MSALMINSDKNMWFPEMYMHHQVIDETEQFLEFQGVRVTPAYLVFSDAFEGKRYKKKCVIQNCGKNPAHIRLFPPSAYSFRVIRKIPGVYLNPGLSICRYIFYTYHRASAVLLASFPIHINHTLVAYKLIVTLSELQISAVPETLDFGLIDAGGLPAVRNLVLRNDGGKASRFAIDLGRNDLELMVEPKEGVLQAKNSVKVRIELLANVSGSFLKEIWIKCEKPLRIPVTGIVVIPGLEAQHPCTTTDFTLIECPKTYFGAQSIKTLLIRNYSSEYAMFCTVAEIQCQNRDMVKAGLLNPNFKRFHVGPTEGTLLPFEGRVFQIVFAPFKDLKETKDKRFEKYFIGFIKILRVLCKEHIVKNVQVMSSKPEKTKLYSVKEEIRSTSSTVFSLEDGTSLSSAMEPNSSMDLSQETQDASIMVRVCLHGEAETADITIVPDELHLTEINLNKTETRVLQLTNLSSNLPIVFKYKKVCYIEVVPEMQQLKPSEKLDIIVKLTPGKQGIHKTKIGFDLLYPNDPFEEQKFFTVGYSEVFVSLDTTVVTKLPKPQFNMGLTPKYTNEVGYFTDDVKYNSSVKKPEAAITYQQSKNLKNCAELIAFPNDRPRSLRNWTNPTVCTTIYSGIPRTYVERGENELTDAEHQLKDRVRATYNNYIREGATARLKKLENKLDDGNQDYEVTDESLEMPKINCLKKKRKVIPQLSAPIPLTPLELYYIKVHPKDINMGKIALNSSSTEEFTIENQNEFAIRVEVVPQKPVIKFPYGNRKIIQPSDEKKIEFTYVSSKFTGLFSVVLDVIINENHAYQVIVMVNVVKKYLRLSTDEVIFQSNDDTIKYFTLFNPLNVPISFAWDLLSQPFTVEPKAGHIPPKRFLICIISYFPTPSGSLVSEMKLHVEGGVDLALKVFAELNPMDVMMENDCVKLNNIPLNLPFTGKAFLKNMSFKPISYQVQNTEPFPGITITPAQGTLHSRSVQQFNINLRIQACISFSCIATVEVERSSCLEFKIVGNVVFPNVLITPNIINLRKIIPYGLDRQSFEVTNICSTIAMIQFPMHDYGEYKISDSSYTEVSDDGITLQPGEKKQLFLNFASLDVALYYFYLPVILNGIIGPACLNMAHTLTPEYYTKEADEEYQLLDDVKLLPLPNSLHTCKIGCSVAAYMLQFKSLFFKFQYSPHPKFHSICEEKLLVRNVCKQKTEFCIRTDNLCEPFSMKYIKGKYIEPYEQSIVCRLEPQESVTFLIKFEPTEQGHYLIKLPLYIRNYLQGSVFNYLTFQGTYFEPIISYPESVIFFEPFPLKSKTEYPITLNFSYHLETCRIEASTDIQSLLIIFPEGQQPKSKELTETICVTLEYTSSHSTSFDSHVTFYCSCGANFSLKVKGCTENCSLTAHGFLKSYVVRAVNKRLPGVTPTFVQNNFIPTKLGWPKVNTVQEMFCEGGDTIVDVISSSNIYENAMNGKNTEYPMFPDEISDSAYAVHMRITLEMTEEWMYHQGFYKKSFYKIPEGIAAVPRESPKIDDKKNKNKQKTTKMEKNEELVLTYVQLLINLAGSSVKKYLPNRSMPTENIERVNFIYNSYRDAKTFLQANYGYLAHVYPEHLLEYDDYLTFLKYVIPLRCDIEETAPIQLKYTLFYRISKQSWLDMILQTFKVLVLYRVQRPRRSLTSRSRSQSRRSFTGRLSVKQSMERCSQQTRKSTLTIVRREGGSKVQLEFWKQSAANVPHNGNIHNTSENILLEWMEFHFENQRNILWNPANLCSHQRCPESRSIRFFACDLNDSLVLAAVTSAYCPYLRPAFKHLFLDPITQEEAFHNASVLLQAWKEINCSFSLIPREIIFPNHVQMLMLVTYMFEVFPTLLPYETVSFTAELTRTVSKSITIHNETNMTAKYSVMFFGNSMELFKVSGDTIVLLPNEQKKINITYHAKKLAVVQVTLLLNGDTRGHNYAKSMAFTLIGEPKLSYHTTTVTVPLSLYEIIDTFVAVKSPYEVCALYEVWYSFDQPKDLENLKLREWKNCKTSKLPRTIYTPHVNLQTDETGVGNIALVFSAFLPYSRSCWIYFLNAEVGDFSVELIAACKPKQQQAMKIEVAIPGELLASGCVCPQEEAAEDSAIMKNTDVLELEIPCRNILMWNAVINMLKRALDDSQMAFWVKYLDTSVGMHVFECIKNAEEGKVSPDILHLFKIAVNYSVTSNIEGQLSIQPMVAIENVRSPGVVKIPFSIQAQRIPQSFTLTLASEEGDEIRKYEIEFVAET